MYSSSYSQAKYGLEARGPPHKSKGKSCGYYMRIIFFFSSLIQTLIIVSLVLFLIYGQPAKSAVEKRVEELEQSFNRVSDSNIQLRKEKSELGSRLRVQTAEKTALEKDMEKLKLQANKTENDLKIKLTSCLNQIMMKRCPPSIPVMLNNGNELKTCQSHVAQQKALIDLIRTNFTRTVEYLSRERDDALKERDTQHQDAIALRRENTMVKENLSSYTRKCKEDFVQSLDGIRTVTANFLDRIKNLFHNDMTFRLTCEREREQMEKIRNSCTNLSRDVETKFQLYLDNVGIKIAEIQGQSSRLEVQNSHLTSDLKQCERSRNETIVDAARQLQLKQKAHDDQMEKLLLEQARLRKQKEQLEDSLTRREKELESCRTMFPAQPKFGGPKAGGLQAAPTNNGETDIRKPSVVT